jgi:hypothetical protein
MHVVLLLATTHDGTFVLPAGHCLQERAGWDGCMGI